jgi:hypothetical protein
LGSICGFLLVAVVAAASDELRVVLPEDQPVAGWVESRALSPDEQNVLARLDSELLSRVLQLRVDAESVLPPMLGEVGLESGKLIFRPRFPFKAGLGYRATLHLPGRELTEFAFKIPEAASRSTSEVRRVLPDAVAVPENLLRFYVEFSAPMHPGSILAHVELLDERGLVIPDAFVETVPLWDYENRRVTLICHPGRIKRGLELHERAGAPLANTGSVTLRILRSAADANGQSLVDAFEREYAVLPADRVSPQFERWSWQRAEPGTLEPMEVVFDEELDAVLLDRMLAVVDSDGDTVEGAGVAQPGGMGWSFRPTAAWAEGCHHLRVAGELEDLAGNRVDGPFERGYSTARAADSSTIELCRQGCPGR